MLFELRRSLDSKIPPDRHDQLQGHIMAPKNLTSAPGHGPLFLSGGGEMGALIRAYDWSRTPLGSPDRWPQSLRSTLSVCLNSPMRGAVFWGGDLRLLYNDAYIPSLTDRHPAALGQPVSEVWGEAWDAVAELYLGAMRTGEGFSQNDVQLPMVKSGKTETTYWNITASPIRGEDGSVVGLLNQGVDITADYLGRQNQARALLLHENIVQSDASPICVFDTEFRLIGFNAAHSDEFCRIYNYRVQIGDVFPDLFLPDQAPIIRGFMARALAGETFTVIEEFGDPDLAKPYWEVAYTPLRDDEGVIFGAYHHAKDISVRLRAQAELARVQEALRQSQKMEAVGQLTGGIAHDFNNMLTGILGSLEMLQVRIEQNQLDRADRYIKAAEGSARRAAQLTQRLLAFSRRQTLDPKPTNIDALVVGVKEIVDRTVGPGIAVSAVAADELWFVSIDAGQLENALLNLCLNARDAMPTGGQITIHTRNETLDDEAAADKRLMVGEYVSITVSDTGTGMAPETVARAFEPFFTTKALGEGTGLGLSMIYGFAQQSGGQAVLESALGQGTEASIMLPRYVGKVREDLQLKPEAKSLPGAGRRILIVDDEPTIRELVDETLTDQGYTTITVGDGAAAVEILRSGATIDLLITDIGLPDGMDGRQVADTARQHRPELRILFITGYAEQATTAPSSLQRGTALLTKPFSMQTLTVRVGEMLLE